MFVIDGIFIIISITIIIIIYHNGLVELQIFPVDGRSLYHLLKLLLMGDERWQVSIGLILLARFHKYIKDGSILFLLYPSYLKAQMDPASAVCTRRGQAGR